MVYIRKCNGSDCTTREPELGLGWLGGRAGLESASPLPFEMKKTASVSKLLDKNCTFVNGGLWLVKKINVFFLTSLFPYTNNRFTIIIKHWQCHSKTITLRYLISLHLPFLGGYRVARITGLEPATSG